MKTKQISNNAQSLCAQLPMDDGIDAKTLAKRDQPAHKDRKMHQVCRQAERALSFVFSGEMGNALLQSLYIDSVEPAPDSSHLLITIGSYDAADNTHIDALLAALKGAEGKLRSAVALAVNRKRAPQLSFRYRFKSSPPALRCAGGANMSPL